MKKIPTIFLREWNPEGGNKVVDQINPAAQWVFDGEGIATRKLDGTCCLLRGGVLLKRREMTRQQMENDAPAGFELEDSDPLTDKVVGWVPVGDGPEDRWHRMAMIDALERGFVDGSYELVGPKVQGNPENYRGHVLVRHDDGLALDGEPDRDFAHIRAFLDGRDIEGIVFHHPDGRMAKIKGKDFGFKRPKK